VTRLAHHSVGKTPSRLLRHSHPETRRPGAARGPSSIPRMVMIWTAGSHDTGSGILGYAWWCTSDHRNAGSAIGSDNEAELLAVLDALGHADTAHPGESATVWTDSRHVADVPYGARRRTNCPELWTDITIHLDHGNAQIQRPPQGQDHPLLQIADSMAFGAMAAHRRRYQPITEVTLTRPTTEVPLSATEQALQQILTATHELLDE